MDLSRATILQDADFDLLQGLADHIAQEVLGNGGLLDVAVHALAASRLINERRYLQTTGDSNLNAREYPGFERLPEWASDLDIGSLIVMKISECFSRAARNYDFTKTSWRLPAGSNRKQALDEYLRSRAEPKPEFPRWVTYTWRTSPQLIFHGLRELCLSKDSAREVLRLIDEFRPGKQKPTKNIDSRAEDPLSDGVAQRLLGVLPKIQTMLISAGFTPEEAERGVHAMASAVLEGDSTPPAPAQREEPKRENATSLRGASAELVGRQEEHQYRVGKRGPMRRKTDAELEAIASFKVVDPKADPATAAKAANRARNLLTKRRSAARSVTSIPHR